jgi:hypothetical protein
MALAAPLLRLRLLPLAAFVSVVSLTAAPRRAEAWGKQGHIIVCKIAEVSAHHGFANPLPPLLAQHLKRLQLESNTECCTCRSTCRRRRRRRWRSCCRSRPAGSCRRCARGPTRCDSTTTGLVLSTTPTPPKSATSSTHVRLHSPPQS